MRLPLAISAANVERLWQLGEKLVPVAVTALGGWLVARVRARRRREQAEADQRERDRRLLYAVAAALQVLLEEANYRDWTTATGRFSVVEGVDNIRRGEYREKRKRVTDELREALGIEDQRRASAADRAEYARQMREQDVIPEEQLEDDER